MYNDLGLTNKVKKILIIGAGLFGAAIGLRLKRENEIYFYEVDKKRVYHWREEGSFDFWEDIKIPANFKISTEMPEGKFDFLFLALPSKFLVESFEKFNNKSKTIVILSKGFDPDEKEFPYEIFSKKTTKEIVVFGGPDFASEIARGGVFGATLASSSSEASEEVAKLFDENFKAQIINDPLGVEFLGIAKNVAAIFMGYLKGKGKSQSEKMFYLTKMFDEIRQIGIKIGVKNETFFSLAGFGDFVLTTLSDKSRNKKLGFLISRGEQENFDETTEGVHSAKILLEIAQKNNLNTPLVAKTVDILSCCRYK